MITPIGKRVVLRQLADKESGAIHIPEQFRQKQSGEVVALGTGAPNFSFSVAVGDRVILPLNYFPTETEIDGETCFIVPEINLLAVLETEKEAA